MLDPKEAPVMKKFKVSYKWDIPADYEEVGRIGGYGIAIKDEALHLIGKKIFCISESHILQAIIFPFPGDNPPIPKDSDLDMTFDFNPKKIYYGVQYGIDGGVYIFESKEIALMMINLMLDVKIDGLEKRDK